MLIVLFLSRYIQDAPLETEEKPKLDIVGSILSALGMELIVFGILLAGIYGWWKARQPFSIGGIEISPFGLSPTPLFILAGGIILLCFALWERHVINLGKMPLIRLDVLRDRGVTSGIFVQMVQTLLIGGFLFSMALFFQIAMGLNAMQTGLSLPPPLNTAFNCFAYSIPVICPHSPKTHHPAWATRTCCRASTGYCNH